MFKTDTFKIQIYFCMPATLRSWYVQTIRSSTKNKPEIHEDYSKKCIISVWSSLHNSIEKCKETF